MIIIDFRKNESENFFYFKITGHSPASLGSPGENLLCAAVSVLGQSLLLYLQKKEVVKIQNLEKGFLEFHLTETDKELDIAVDVIVEGLMDLQRQYPEIINFSIYTGEKNGT